MFTKVKRINDPQAIEDARRPYCQYCGLSRTDIAYHVHHIKTKKSGGDDILENLICLCPECHTKAHAGMIKKQDLIDLKLADMKRRG